MRRVFVSSSPFLLHRNLCKCSRDSKENKAKLNRLQNADKVDGLIYLVVCMHCIHILHCHIGNCATETAECETQVD